MSQTKHLNEFFIVSSPEKSPLVVIPGALEQAMLVQPRALFTPTVTTGTVAQFSTAKVVGGVGKPAAKPAAKPTWEKTTPMDLDRLGRIFK